MTIKAHTHQISGSTIDYNMNTSQDVSDVLKSTAYLSVVKVGLIPKDQLQRIIQETPSPSVTPGGPIVTGSFQLYRVSRTKGTALRPSR